MRDPNGLDDQGAVAGSPARRRRAAEVAGLAIAVDLGAALAWSIELQGRPPCPDGAVRLVDLAVSMPQVALVSALVAVLLTVGTVVVRRPWICGSLAVVVLLFGLLIGGTAVATIRQDRLDPGGDCWSF